MKRYFVLLLSIFLCVISVYAQEAPSESIVAQSCYEMTFKKGLSLFNHGKYAEAKTQFVAAKSCPDKPADNELDLWIKRCEEQIVTIEITNAVFCNVTNEGTVIDPYGSSLYAGKIKYVKPKVTYTSHLSGEKKIKLNVKVLKPDGDMLFSGSSPNGYTYSSEITMKTGSSNTVELLGWGNSSGGTYSEGTYTMEFWYKNKRLYSKSFHVYAGNGSSSSGSSSGSGSSGSNYGSGSNNNNSSYNQGGRTTPIRGGKWERLLDDIMRNASVLTGGDRYLGEKDSDGYRHGWGIYKWSSGTIYVGKWRRGDFDGGGMYLCPDGYEIRNLTDGQFFAGYYERDTKTSGRVYDENGNMLYIGSFNNDKPENEYPKFSTTSPMLVIEYNNGDLFVGETDGSRPYGFGLYLWHDGGAWFGFWADGVRKGSGFYVSESGNITSGTWDNNTMN